MASELKYQDSEACFYKMTFIKNGEESKLIGIVDYEAGNTLSVIKALKYLGMDVELTNDRQKLLKSDHIVFPGVGAYYDAMEKLRKYDLISTIKEAVDNGIPFLGICLGMQLLFESSEETIGAPDQNAKIVNGLGILDGKISRFNEKEGYKIPHMGWNSIEFSKDGLRLFKDVPDNSYFYFVHSYYLKAADEKCVAARTDYIQKFDSAVEYGNIFGCQFHPEKSSDQGLQVLRNFCEV